MTRLKSILREPLVQFLLIGALLAAAFALLPDQTAPVVDDVIVVSAGDRDQLSKLFERTWNRPPTEAELTGVIDRFVRDEILFRVGTELGLGQDDAMVRRRIVQKMQFLLEPDPERLSPTDEELEAYFAANRDDFRIEQQLAFEQVFFDEARHGEALDAVMQVAQVALRAGEPVEDVGESTLIPPRFALTQVSDLAREMGGDFVDALKDLPVGEWTGPVRSPFGVHLVRVTQSEPARDATFDEMRPRVIASWTAQRRDELAKQRFDELASRFRVVRSPPGSGS